METSMCKSDPKLPLRNIVKTKGVRPGVGIDTHKINVFPSVSKHPYVR